MVLFSILYNLIFSISLRWVFLSVMYMNFTILSYFVSTVVTPLLYPHLKILTNIFMFINLTTLSSILIFNQSINFPLYMSIAPIVLLFANDALLG